MPSLVGSEMCIRDREKLYAVQTPQCFRTALYRQVLAQVCCDAVTDDCSAFELAGLPVRLTQGDYANYKITTREDLPAPEKNGGNGMRIGHGYDVHRLVEGRALVLGGVTVPYEKGLLGHSDADVLTHAVMDALLGAAALGDIGKLFPDTDPAYKGADSIALPVSYTHLRAHETRHDLVCRLLLEKKKKRKAEISYAVFGHRRRRYKAKTKNKKS